MLSASFGNRRLNAATRDCTEDERDDRDDQQDHTDPQEEVQRVNETTSEKKYNGNDGKNDKEQVHCFSFALVG